MAPVDAARGASRGSRRLPSDGDDRSPPGAAGSPAGRGGDKRPKARGCELSTFCIQSGDITQHLAPMVNRLLRRLRRWTAVESVLARVAGQFTTWPADDFGKFVSASIGTGMAGAVAAMPPLTEPLRPAPPTSIAPATFEMRFMKLHAEGRFDEMWEMLAEDAQRAWGGRETFMRDMPRLDDDVELLDMQVVSVKCHRRLDRSSASARLQQRRANGDALSRPAAVARVDIRPPGPSCPGGRWMANIVLSDKSQNCRGALI